MFGYGGYGYGYGGYRYGCCGGYGGCGSTYIVLVLFILLAIILSFGFIR